MGSDPRMRNSSFFFFFFVSHPLRGFLLWGGGGGFAEGKGTSICPGHCQEGQAVSKEAAGQ